MKNIDKFALALDSANSTPKLKNLKSDRPIIFSNTGKDIILGSDLKKFTEEIFSGD
jgi:hypothetical protein